jgi:hypothetical protein
MLRFHKLFNAGRPFVLLQQLEEARRLLDLAMRELEATRAAAAAQSKLYETRMRHLEEQLRIARHERDAAAERAKALSESVRAARAPEPPSPSTTLLGGFDSRAETPGRAPSPSPSAQIAHQLADVRNQLEQIRQQRAFPSSTAQLNIPSQSEDLRGSRDLGDVARQKSPRLPPHRVPSPMPTLPTGSFSLSPTATESFSGVISPTATLSLPNVFHSPGLSSQPSPAPLPYSQPGLSSQPAHSHPSEAPPRTPYRAPPFHPPQPHPPQPSVSRPHPLEPPGFALPRQGELLRTIERAAPLLNILMLGSLGPLPRWKNPPYAARPPLAPALLRHVPPAPFPGGPSSPAPAALPLYGETPRASLPGGFPAANEAASLQGRSSIAQPSSSFPAGFGGQPPAPQGWHYTPSGEASLPGAQTAQAVHSHSAAASQVPAVNAPREESDPSGMVLERPGQTSRQVQAGDSQVPTANPHRRGQ